MNFDGVGSGCSVGGWEATGVVVAAVGGGLPMSASVGVGDGVGMGVLVGKVELIPPLGSPDPADVVGEALPPELPAPDAETDAETDERGLADPAPPEPGDAAPELPGEADFAVVLAGFREPDTADPSVSRTGQPASAAAMAAGIHLTRDFFNSEAPRGG